jgi:sugar lactone lactonase YvrE
MNYHNIFNKCVLVTALSFSSLVTAADYSTFTTMRQGFNDALSFDPQGNLYVSHGGDFGSTGLLGTTVQKVTPAGDITDVATNFNGPTGHDIDSKGNIFVANYNNGTIDKVTPAGVVSSFVDLGGSSFASSILINSPDDMFVTSDGSNKNFKVSASGNSEEWVSGNGLNGPVGIVMDEDENIYVSNYNNGKVFKVNSDKTITEISDTPGGIGYITYIDGMIYATGINTHKIYQIPVSGGTAIELQGSDTAGFTSPNGIAISNDGSKIYVSNYSSNNRKIIVIENFREIASTTPQANNDSATVDMDSVITIDILSNDTINSVALDMASVYLATAVQNGTTSVDDATGSITYTPTAGYNGEDSFVYTVANINGEISNEASVAITVTQPEVTPPPVVTPPVVTPPVVTPPAKDSGGSFGTILFAMCLVLTRKLSLITSPKNK